MSIELNTYTHTNKESMSIQLDTRNGHDKEIVDRFNAISQKYGDDALLDHILCRWADDSDLLDITISLEDALDTGW